MPASSEPAEHLLEQGWRLDTLGVDAATAWSAWSGSPPLLGPQTRLVSVMLGNHETGVLQPVAELAARFATAPACRCTATPWPWPANCRIDFRRLGLAAMSVAAHKFHGPLGIAALLLRHDVPLQPLCFGGHQQQGLRPGTEPVALAVGMATALELWQQEQQPSCDG